MSYVIGVDGGGTHTKSVVLAVDGRVLGTGRAGPSNYRRIGLDAAFENVRQSALQALEAAGVSPPARAACFCIAGAGRTPELVLPGLRALELASENVLFHDAKAALAGAHLLQPGLVVIAGTGAVVYGEDGAGQQVQVDGWGPLLGDAGSGYWIGLQTLRSVLRAHDGREASTLLSGMVLEHFGVDTPPDLLAELPLDRTNSKLVSEVAGVCAQAAGRSDAVARRILEQAGEYLADSASAAIRALELQPVPRIAVAGGVLDNGLVRDAFEQALAEQWPDVAVGAPELPPVFGAALLALRAADTEPDEGVIDNLRRSRAVCG